MQIDVSNSILFYEKSKKIIPASSSTLAKSPERLEKGYSPFLQRKHTAVILLI